MAKGPCWEGYVQVGMKMKNGKKVPNCVPSKKAKRTASIEEQNQKIIDAVFVIVDKANSHFSGTRLVTKSAILEIVEDSLEQNEKETFSLRKHKALSAVSRYITLAQRNKVLGARAEYTDLLPVAHPRSTRDHELSGAELMKYRARWITDDPSITDDSARTILASALTSHPASVEYEYAIARLSTLPQGMIPQYALVAALGDGNSSAARRARALLQRRDRKGRFAEMGGGLRALIRRTTGKVVQSLTGRTVSQSIDGESFIMELPDGKLVKVPTGSAEGIKAILPSMQTKDGYSKSAAKYVTGDPIVNEADLEVVDAPDGFSLDNSWSPSEADVDFYGTKTDLGKKYTDDAYDVIKFDKPNAPAKDKFEAAQQKESEGQNIVTLGQGKDGWLDPEKPVYFISRRDGKNKTFAATQSWADAQQFISQDEPRYEKNELPEPNKVTVPKGKKAKATLPTEAEKVDVETAKGELIPALPDLTKKDMRDYKKALKKYEKSGGLYPLDPSKNHMVLPDGTVVDPDTGEITRDASGKKAPKAKAAPTDFDYPDGYYKVAKGADYTPEGAVEGQESPDFTDDPAELAQKFESDELKAALKQSVTGSPEEPATGYGVLPFEAGDEILPAEAIYNALKEKGEDADAALAEIYDAGNAEKAITDEFGEPKFATPEVEDAVKEELGKDLPEAPMPEGEGDPATLPPLLDGLTDEEKDEYAKTGDYKKHLPKNEIFEVPTGYTELNEDPFNKDESILPDDAPEGFTFDPVDLANSYTKEQLSNELVRAVEPGSEMPGYGMLGQETPEGEQYVGYVPGEAIRDALQLQGEDTNSLLKDIYAEGAEQPSAEEINETLKGVETETTEGTPATEETTPSTEADQGQIPPAEGTAVKVGNPDGPAKLKAKVTELKAGDVTARDFFTITKVESGFEKKRGGQMVPASQITGYYPGGVEQSSKLWADDVDITVYRNVDTPTKGDLPELNQPELGSYGPLTKVDGKWQLKNPAAQAKYEEDYAEYTKKLDAQKAMWSEPEGLEEWNTEDTVPAYTVENPIGVSEVASVDVKPGDITFKKEGKADFYEFFVVQDVSTDENGNAVVTGFYPGHEVQTKSWKGTTKIQVIKGATAPEPGSKPALERPKKDDPDYKEKYAEFTAAKKESAATWQSPIDLDAVATKTTPKPKRPTPPAFQGSKLKEIAEAAGGDPAKFKELLNNEEIVHLDFESTGGFTNTTPIQVAMYKVKNGETVDQKVLFMNPEMPLDDFYTSKDPSQILKDSDGNPISDEFLSKQMSLEDAFKEIADFLGENPIVSAHNLPFDEGILKNFTSQFGLPYNPSGQIDTLSLARKVINGANGDHTLEAVASRYGLSSPDTDWHDASVDAEFLPNILNSLLDEMNTTKSGVGQLDVDKSKADFDAENDAYKAATSKSKKADAELVMAKAFADGMAGKDVPTTDDLASALPKDLPSSEELSPATAAKPEEVSDGDFQVESILGGIVSNNWVADPENATNVGKIAVEEWMPGDFIKAQNGGWHEVMELIPDPSNDKRIFVKRRLLANGEIYGDPEKEGSKSWVKYQGYEVWRRNGVAPEEKPEPQVEQPALKVEEAPEKESNEGKWKGYNIAKGDDGVYYAENISGADVQGLRNGTLTPPNLPFFAPLSGGNNQETGEGYYFASDGKRYWGKFGAAGALVRRKNSDGNYEYFLAKRSSGLSSGGGKWGFPGGAHKDQTMAKSPGATAKQEFMEEVGGDLSGLEPKFVHNNFVSPDWAYETNVFEVGPGKFDELSPKDGENSEVGWFTADQIIAMGENGQLHPSFTDSASGIFALTEDEQKAPEKPIPSTAPSTFGEISNPFDTSDWVKSGGQAGSNEGAFYTDPKTGDQYYVKKPKSDKHAANEVLASALYEEAGVKTGRVFFGKDKKGNTVLVSPLVPNSKKNFSTAKDDSEILKNAQADFAVDAWLNNYDVVGLDYDNMLTVGKDVYRVDPGGALLFRAQGKDKKKDLTDDVKSIDTYRDPSINPQASDVFGSMTDADIAESAKKVQAISPEKIDQLVDAAFPEDLETAAFLKEKLKNRREDLIKRFGLAEEKPEEKKPEPVQEVSSEDSIVSFFPAGDYIKQITDTINAGKKLGFKYTDSKGKESVKVVTPVKAKDGGPSIWTNTKNGKVNLRAIDSDGVIKNFTIKQMEELPEDYAPEVSEKGAASETGVSTPSTPENIIPATPEPDSAPEEVDKPTEVPQAEKAKLLEDLSSLAEKVFGKAPNKETLKNLLSSLKEQGGNSDLIDSTIADLDAPEPKELETPADKIAEDIAQELVPDSDGGELATPAPLTPSAIEKILSNPDETNPEIIWNNIKNAYEGSVLDSGHIVVHSVEHGDVQYDVVVRRNEDNSFSVYHRLTNNLDGTTKAYALTKKNHSAEALKNTIASQIWNANNKPKYLKGKAKPETGKTLMPTSAFKVPTEAEAFVAADGTILQKGDVIEIVNPTHSKFGQKAKILATKRKISSKGYGYTDYLKVKYEDGEKNQIVSKSVKPAGSDWKWGDPKKSFLTPPPSTPTTPSKPTPAPDDDGGITPSPNDSIAPSLGNAKKLSEVEPLASAKNSDAHVGYFGATNYADYKEFLKGKFLKDPESKNMVPGIIVSNASPNSGDQDLTSYGVIKSVNTKDGKVEVGYFDGPLAGKSATLDANKVWSREKFLTNEQAAELGIGVDPTYRDLARAAAKAKGEKYQKELKAQQLKAQQDAEAKALKSKFEVNGPGFALATADKNAPADWSKSPVENAPSLSTALKVAKGDDPIQAAKGSTVLGDSDAIEDLEIRVQKVTAKGGKESLRVTFTLTDWAANARVGEMIDDPDIKKSAGLEIDKWEKQPDGSLKYSKVWENSSVDQKGNGVTYSGKAGKGTFKLHRAKKGAEKADFFKHASNSSHSVAFHNKVEMTLPINATEKDIEDAIKAMGGVDNVRPATAADIKGLIENKMIWLYGRNTDGTKNYSGELRQKILDRIKDDYGFTADDVEVFADKDARGRITYLVPQSVADKIASQSGVNYFYHNWQSGTPSGTTAYTDFLFGVFQSGSLYSTTNRWMDGINTNGMSSKQDVKANGGNYMFTHPSSSKNNGYDLTFTFDARKLLRRMDFYKNNYDKYGQLESEQEDVISKLKSGGGEIMWKKNLSWADLASITIPSAVRAALVKKLLDAGMPEYAKIVKGE